MRPRVAVPVLATLVALVAALLTLTLSPRVYALLERSVEFQDGHGNARVAFVPGELAQLYVRDAGMATVETSTATWAVLGRQVETGEWWSLATGAPDSFSYELSAGSEYDIATPSNTPLRSVPTARVNDVPVLLTDYRAPTGEFKLLFDVNASSTLQVDFDFDFDVVDAYLATERLV